MSTFYRIGEFAEKIGVSIQTLRRWDKEGTLKPAKVTIGGTRYYSESQFMGYCNRAPANQKSKIYAFVVRVSDTPSITAYMAAKGYSYTEVTNYYQMLDLITNYSTKTVVFMLDTDITPELQLLADKFDVLVECIKGDTCL